MWVIVYRPLPPPRALLDGTTLWHRDSGTANPSSPESFVNRRMVVPKPPPAVFRYLYRNSYDTSRVNPELPQSFVNRRTRINLPPRRAFRNLYYPGTDSSFSNPSTPLSWPSQPEPLLRRRVPLGQFAALYWWSEPSDQSTEPAPPWIARRLRQPYAPATERGLYFGGDTSQSDTTGADGGGSQWPPAHTIATGAGRMAGRARAMALLYFSATGGDEPTPPPTPTGSLYIPTYRPRRR